MKTLNVIFCTVLASCLIGISQVALAEKRALSADEVTAMFSDKTVWGHHTNKPKKYMVYYSPDGTFKRKRIVEGSTNQNGIAVVLSSSQSGGGIYKTKQVDTNKIVQGKWSVDEKGRLCIKKKKKKCRMIVDDNGVIKRYKESNNHVWTFTKFEDGDKF